MKCQFGLCSIFTAADTETVGISSNVWVRDCYVLLMNSSEYTDFECQHELEMSRIPLNSLSFSIQVISSLWQKLVEPNVKCIRVRLTKAWRYHRFLVYNISFVLQSMRNLAKPNSYDHTRIFSYKLDCDCGWNHSYYSTCLQVDYLPVRDFEILTRPQNLKFKILLEKNECFEMKLFEKFNDLSHSDWNLEDFLRFLSYRKKHNYMSYFEKHLFMCIQFYYLPVFDTTQFWE